MSNKEAIELQKEVVKFLNTISELMLSNDMAVVGDLKVARARAKTVLTELEKQPEPGDDGTWVKGELEDINNAEKQARKTKLMVEKQPEPTFNYSHQDEVRKIIKSVLQRALLPERGYSPAGD
ncbi:hypothetical protein LCGC14_2317420, partial [marine sediment metagenome]